MQRLSPRFGSPQLFLSKIDFTQIYKDLYGYTILVPIAMGTNMAVGNQEKHLPLSFATKVEIYLSENSKTLK